jgi:site-specific DNA-methyltransferase (adenine-specific)
MNNELMFSSNNQKWATRWSDFNKWNERFNFTFDVCSSDGDQKCLRYFNPHQDGLKQSWIGETFFCNPPYDREQIKWVQHGIDQKASGVYLLPARTDTKLFHEVVLPNCKVEFIKGRITFGSDEYWAWVWEQPILNDKKNSLYKKYSKMNPAPFPSMLVLLNIQE